VVGVHHGVTTSLYQNGLFWNAEQWAVTVKEPSSYTGTPTIQPGNRAIGTLRATR